MRISKVSMRPLSKESSKQSIRTIMESKLLLAGSIERVETIAITPIELFLRRQEDIVP